MNEREPEMRIYRKQEILTFVSSTSSVAQVWSFFEMVPNDPNGVPSDHLMQTRDGQWYLASINWFSTLARAEKYANGGYYSEAIEIVTKLY